MRIRLVVSLLLVILPLLALPAPGAFVAAAAGIAPDSTQQPAAGSQQPGEAATIRIKADVGEADVFLDGKEAGKSPVTLTGVAPGAHQVTLTRPGYEDHQEQVQVAPGSTAKVFAMMKAIKAELPKFPVQFYAVHQHAAGACTGLLTVTADALDYKASDGKDVFHIPIAEVKSLSRSMGTAWWTASPLRTPGEYAGCRLELPGRSVGFFAFAEDPGPLGGPTENRAKFRQAEKTKELFELVYRLWMDSLAQRGIKAK